MAGMVEPRVEAWERRTEIPLAVVALIFLVAYAWPILEPGLARSWVIVSEVVIFATWLSIVADFVIRLLLSRDKWRFVRANPLDLAIVVLPLLRPLRLLQLVVLLNVLNRFAGHSLRGRVGMYLVLSASILVVVSSLAMLDAERGHDGEIQTIGDALWWSMTTITTVGYGDTYPVTGEGRFIAAGLMLAGIAVLGVVTASFASWLVERVAEADEEAEAATRADIHALRHEVRTLRAELDSLRPDDPPTR